ncbi:unnamed protein product [Nyctereutes procyonoides]|uniref:(raccoon dog) hypothetical protein n=1 Tax=Nyctereutes procyonoides TaxID=34880 RepID=A0A811Y9U7_NYCPR|nr:unnamed protein product [Nyctereutes procyonoides]
MLLGLHTATEMRNIARHLNQEVAVHAYQFRWSKRLASHPGIPISGSLKKNIQRFVSELYVWHNCHPFRVTELVWILVPLWVFTSVALWNSLAIDGVLEFPDLTVLIFALQKIGMSHFQTYIAHFVQYCFTGHLQNLLMCSARFCQLCLILVTKSDSGIPYKDLFAAFTLSLFQENDMLFSNFQTVAVSLSQ